MSVQLTLYPQNYNGQYNLLSADPFNLIADQDFSEIVHQNDTNAFIYTGISYANQHYLIYNAAVDFVMQGNGTNLYLNAWKVFSTGIPNIERIGGTNPKLQFWYQHTSGFIMRVPGTTTGAQWEFSVRQRYKESGSEGGELRLLCLDGYAGSFAADIIYNVAASPSGDTTPETFSTTFTANGSYSYVLMTWRANNQSNSNDSLIIDRVSVKEVTTTPTGSSTLVSNGSVIVDLYEDEDIPLTLSVDNFKNAAEKVQSYSKAFKLPASKRNNKIFDSIFEITRETQGTTLFNPYIKTKATLKQNGFLLFEGYLKLIDITEKDQERSYNVNLYSEAIALADVLKGKTFNEINFEELNHPYNRTQIAYSYNDSGTAITWSNPNTSGFRTDFKTLKYPFVDWNHQMTVAPSGGSQTEGMPILDSLEQVFRPWISLHYLINRIFADSPFTYKSDLFDSDDFKNLYMDFNWGDGEQAPTFTKSGSKRNYFVTNTYPQMNYPINNGTYKETLPNDKENGFNRETGGYSDRLGHVIYEENSTTVSTTPAYTDWSAWVASYDNQEYTMTVLLRTRSDNAGSGISHILDAKWVHETAAGVKTDIPATLFTSSNNLINDYEITFTKIIQTGDKLYMMAKADTSDIKVLYCKVDATTSASVDVDSAAFNSIRGELEQWYFLKGIFTMYNLIATPDKENPFQINIEPYPEVFIKDTKSGTTTDLGLSARSITHDWTEKIDVSQIKLEPLTDIDRVVHLKYAEDDDDYMFTNYKKSVQGHLYGSKVYDSNYSLLQGTKEIIAEPFAATIMKPLMSQYPELVIPSIYSLSDDGECSGFENAPRICYNNGVVDLSAFGISYYIPEQNGVVSSNADEYLRFSHLSELPIDFQNDDTRDVNFGACQLVVGADLATPVVDNLYNRYWAPYLNELYSPDTRTMTLKVDLHAGDIQSFEFSDYVFIKNRTFRVNRIDYKPNDLSTVEFILINTITHEL